MSLSAVLRPLKKMEEEKLIWTCGNVRGEKKIKVQHELS